MSAHSIVDLVLVGLFTIVAILVVLTVWFFRTTKPLPAALEGLDALPPPRRRRRSARPAAAPVEPPEPSQAFAPSQTSEPSQPADPVGPADLEPEPDSTVEPAQ